MTRVELAPNKALSTMKLELQAAFLGSKVAPHTETLILDPFPHVSFGPTTTLSAAGYDTLRHSTKSSSPTVSLFPSSTSLEEWRYVPGS